MKNQSFVRHFIVSLHCRSTEADAIEVHKAILRCCSCSFFLGTFRQPEAGLLSLRRACGAVRAEVWQTHSSAASRESQNCLHFGATIKRRYVRPTAEAGGWRAVDGTLSRGRPDVVVREGWFHSYNPIYHIGFVVLLGMQTWNLAGNKLPEVRSEFLADGI